MTEHPIPRLGTNPRLSAVSCYAGFAFLSGQTCSEPFGDVQDETAKLLSKIDGLLANAGSARDRLLHATIHLSDLRHYDAFNTAWDQWIDPSSVPSRTCVQALLPRKECRVEITIIAT
ncbi:MAG: RidA family protein [Pseudomonadota bacterium]